jgi:membrane fusion protein (multidrug efflux system)
MLNSQTRFKLEFFMVVTRLGVSLSVASRQNLVRLASALVMVALIGGCSKPPPPVATKPPVEVTTLVVTPRDTPISMEYVAQTQSSQRVNIQARVSGFLDKAVFVEGDPVKVGQVMFRMDQKPFQAQLDAAEAALVRQQAAMRAASANLARVKPLAELNALSKKDLDDSTAQFETSAASVEQAKAAVVEAKLNLSYCTITSPLAGVAAAAMVNDGTYIHVENSLLTTVSAVSPMWANFSVSENEIQNHRTDISKGRITPPPNNDYVVDVIQADGTLFPHKGRITFAAPEYNAQTGTFMLRVSIANPEKILKANQFVRVRLHGAIRPNATLVPQSSVMKGAKGHFVFVVDKENKAQIRSVEVGSWHGDDWFINNGLTAGDVVVVSGVMRLSPDASVKIINAAAKAPAAAPKTVPAVEPKPGSASNSHPTLASNGTRYALKLSSSIAQYTPNEQKLNNSVAPASSGLKLNNLVAQYTLDSISTRAKK